MKIGIAADHGGFELKNTTKIFLENKGYEVQDYAPMSWCLLMIILIL